MSPPSHLPFAAVDGSRFFPHEGGVLVVLMLVLRADLLFVKTKQLFDLASTKANLLEEGARGAFARVPVKGFVQGLHLSSDDLVLAVAKRRSVLFFSIKALEQQVHLCVCGTCIDGNHHADVHFLPMPSLSRVQHHWAKCASVPPQKKR